MPKQRTGWVTQENSKWYAIYTYTDRAGNRRKVRRTADPNNKTAAGNLLKKLLREHDDNGPQFVQAEIRTFAQLADWYEKRYVQPPTYVNNRKVSGLRSYKSVSNRLDILRGYFGKHKLARITHQDLEDFKLARLQKKSVRKAQISITSVNRELEILRRMFSLAMRQGWIIRNPFNTGDTLISKADERSKERILTFEEEEKLLAACTGLRRHLANIIVFSIDMGTRPNETFSLSWKDVEFGASEIVVRELNSKTAKERKVAMTARVRTSLLEIYMKSGQDPDARVFGIKDNVRKSFKGAAKDAGMPELDLYDCRHTCATRLVQAGIPIPEVARVLGHDQLSTTYRYINADSQTLRRAADALDQLGNARRLG
jgi:integrase